MQANTVDILYWILRLNLIVFTVAGILITVRVLQYRWRLRIVKLWWYARPLGVLPVFGLFFLGVVLLNPMFSTSDNAGLGRWEWWCYLLMAICTLILTRSLSLIYVTNGGIVKNLTNPHHSILWFSIMDYVVYRDIKTTKFVLLYKEEEEEKPIRLSIRVPKRKEGAFLDLLEKHVRI